MEAFGILPLKFKFVSTLPTITIYLQRYSEIRLQWVIRSTCEKTLANCSKNVDLILVEFRGQNHFLYVKYYQVSESLKTKS